MEEIIKKATAIFERFPEVKLVYLFGSQARGTSGPMSDYDFAVSLADEPFAEMQNIRLKLISDLSRALKTDAVDVVVLELTQSPELKYNIIREGKLLFSREPFKVVIEPRILSEYFDFRAMLRRHHLTNT